MSDNAAIDFLGQSWAAKKKKVTSPTSGDTFFLEITSGDTWNWMWVTLNPGCLFSREVKFGVYINYLYSGLV